MQKLDTEISKIMTGQPKTMWEGVFWGGSEQKIIGYGNYVYERPKGNVEWFYIGLAMQKNYISLYVTAIEDGQYLVRRRANRLGKVKTGASSISFKSLKDVNWPDLLDLLKTARRLMS